MTKSAQMTPISTKSNKRQLSEHAIIGVTGTSTLPCMLICMLKAKSEAAPPKLHASNIMWNIIYSHFSFNSVLPGYCIATEASQDYGAWEFKWQCSEVEQRLLQPMALSQHKLSVLPVQAVFASRQPQGQAHFPGLVPLPRCYAHRRILPS